MRIEPGHAESFVDGTLVLAHPWRQMDWDGTKAAALHVLARHGHHLDTDEALAEYLACFGGPSVTNGPSRHIPAALRNDLLADGAECAACGATEELEIDHMIPLSRGGGSQPENLQVLCKGCNCSKGARTMEEWRG